MAFKVDPRRAPAVSSKPKEALLKGGSTAASRTVDAFKPSAPNLSKPPPAVNVSQPTWNKLPITEKKAMWADYQKTTANMTGAVPGTQPGVTVKNPELYAYLQVHPELKTVQDLVNATYPKGTFESTVKSFGLSPTEVAKNRSASLMDMACEHMASPGPTQPTTPAPTTPAPTEVPPTVPAVPGAPGDPTVKNPALFAYLQAHPEIKTVQNLVNATYPKGTYESTCKSLGLDPIEVAKYRTANLQDWAVVRMPPPGTIPTTVAEANAYHITQYNTAAYGTDYNNYFPPGNDFSDNCGPASLAMALRAQGKMPVGLNPEQEIDYTRALISGTSNSQVTVNGTTYKLLDKDGDPTGYGNIVDGATAAGLKAEHTYGWASLDDALAAGHPVVAAGMISSTWKAQFPADGHYGSAGQVGHFVAVLGKTANGNYLVSDPMFANGAVEMTQAQLKIFMGENPDITTVGT